MQTPGEGAQLTLTAKLFMSFCITRIISIYSKSNPKSLHTLIKPGRGTALGT